jgi:uncharacterized protein
MICLLFLLALELFGHISAAVPAVSNPWGKDADLAFSSAFDALDENLADGSPLTEICTTPLLGKFAEAMIAFHQKVISPADGPRSHYIPSSSQYTLEAMRHYGFFKGYLMGCDRLMRENSDPWVYRTTRDGAGHVIKYDPVP